jgi:hypothetical protein
MSAGWFARTLASAQTAAANLKENVREGTSIRTNLGAALTSVAEAANDRVRRLHARVTGRQSFEDAVRSRRYARAPAPRPHPPPPASSRRCYHPRETVRPSRGR